MKKIIISILLATGTLLLTTSAALALLYIDDGAGGSIDIGGIDNFIVGDSLGNYGDSTELEWINKQLVKFDYIDENDAFTLSQFSKIEDKDVLGNDITPFFAEIYDSATGTLYDPAAYAFDLGYSPDFYSLKIGKGAGSDGILLFDNVANLQFAAFQLTLPAIQLSLQSADGPLPGAEGYFIKNIGAVSHFSTVVPEPATMLLLGTGLAGLAGVAIRRRKK